jgi:hypothetical protein
VRLAACEPKTTAGNLSLIRRACERHGDSASWIGEIEAELSAKEKA